MNETTVLSAVIFQRLSVEKKGSDRINRMDKNGIHRPHVPNPKNSEHSVHSVKGSNLREFRVLKICGSTERLAQFPAPNRDPAAEHLSGFRHAAG
jgi:hypothetical protein